MVKDGARVDAARYGKGDTAGNIGLDDTGDDIGRRTLGRDDQVNAGGTGQLGNTLDRRFHFLAGHRHQIRQLVDDHDDIRHRFGSR